jgi:hypothetical protein
MSNTSQFSLANRKHFADLLNDKPSSLRQRARDRFDAQHQQLYEKLFLESAEKNGATVIHDQINEAKEKISELKSRLNELGFRLDYEGDLETNTAALGLLIDDLIEKRIAKDIGIARDIDARFDSVTMAVMTATSLQEAQQLLKSVQELSK